MIRSEFRLEQVEKKLRGGKKGGEKGGRKGRKEEKERGRGRKGRHIFNV